ncbi:MAG: glucose-6-phosphate isomerase [Planctomycetes bacterium]|nr:glucose-6-phosphate isomerase [Planctomycetota bacterium]
MSATPLPRFLYGNLLEEVVGPDHGITAREREALREAIPAVHRKIEEERKAGRADWMDLPSDPAAAGTIAKAREIGASCANLVVLGIGGSALGTSAVIRALTDPHHDLVAPAPGRPRVIVEDNIDPIRMKALLERVDPATAVFNVVTKSGSTPETMAQFLIVRDFLKRSLGKAWKDHAVVTTDPEKGALRAIAREEGLRAFPVPPGVGGRYSVLSAVGLVPLAAAGFDAAAILRGAAEADAAARRDPASFAGYWIGGLSQILAAAHRKGILALFCYSDALGGVTEWFLQLWGESLGKRTDVSGKEVFAGSTPVKAIGTTDQHSQLQLYTEGPNDKAFLLLAAGGAPDVPIPPAGLKREELDYLEGQSLGKLFDAERKGTEVSLTRAKRPNATVLVPSRSPEAVGALLHVLSLATFFAGVRWNVNPFDQPGVELGKKIAAALMGKKGQDALRREVEDLGKAAKGFEV